VGETAISVRRRPVVAILPSGDELVPLGRVPAAGEIVETNSLMLAAMVEEAGGVATRLPIVPDDPDLLVAALELALGAADLVLLVAGSAKGRGDHAISVIGRIGKVVVQGVAIRPGHPVVLGLSGSTPVIGVPGYPVSAALAFELFGVRLLGELGAPGVGRRTVQAVAGVDIPSHEPSEEWIRVRVGRIGQALVAVPTRRGAGMLSSLARADGLVRVAVGAAHVVEGDEVEVEILGSPAEIERTLLVTGSTEPLLDALSGHHPLVADANGSANGAAALSSGRCHLALVEVEDVPPGSVVVATWERPLGLLVAPGNPLAIAGPPGMFEEATRVANRQRGSSARRFLDALLAAHAIDPARARGYAREARSHSAAAAAVAAGSADYAVAVRSAGARYGLDFVPLETRQIALVAAAGVADDRLAGLRSLLASSAWRATVEELGYAASAPS
jgi:putative molybdopterin biosynthesis protein